MPHFQTKPTIGVTGYWDTIGIFGGFPPSQGVENDQGRHQGDDHRHHYVLCFHDSFPDLTLVTIVILPGTQLSPFSGFIPSKKRGSVGFEFFFLSQRLSRFDCHPDYPGSVISRCSSVKLPNGGFHSHGGTPIAGWFISGKIPI